MVNRKKAKAREIAEEAAAAAKAAEEKAALEQVQAKMEEEKNKKREKANQQLLAFSKTSIQAIMEFGKTSYSAASEFEASMSKIQRATGLTDSQMTATKMAAKDLYKQNLGGSWDELGGTLTETIKLTDQQGTALEQTAKNALLLKDSIGVDVTDSVKSADVMMKQFGITGSQAFGLLAQGAYAKLDPSQLTGAAETYAEDFNKLGFSANQMFDLFAAGSQKGEYSLDQIGKTFQQFEKMAGSGSAKSANALKSLGLNAQQVQKSIAAGGPSAKTAFDQVAGAIAGITDPIKQNAIATDLFGSEFGGMEGQMVAALASARSQFDLTKQTMEQLDRQRISSPGEAFEAFKKQIAADVLIPVGQQLLPAFNQFGTWLTSHEPLIKSFGAALADNFGKAIGSISSALRTVLPYAEAFINYAADMANKVMQWKGVVPVVMGVVGDLAAYKTMVTTITAVTRVWGAVSAVLSANPITLIIAAIIGLGVGLVVAYQKIEWFRNMVDGVWNAIRIGASATMDFFTVTIPNAFNKGINWAIDQINFLINKYNDLVTLGGLLGDGLTIPTITHIGLSTSESAGNGTRGGGAGGHGGTSAVQGSYKTGLPFVPYNGFVAELHKGERVLTAEENKAYTYNSTLAAPVKVVPSYESRSGLAGTAKGSGVNPGAMNINLKVDVKGGSLDSRQTGELTAQFRQAMQQVFQETMRRGGLGGAL
ncbi:hypothetical protein AWM70_03235 [Paenibacillus yonginensis]|uniref:Phage tail tape measure protein domain-containing protein n=1 Tax=Paenibacillus yonginensis TaxID=1462996 RepID=A0A1B1MX16_9BACL|nr:phage tail tape measure protein [Paenibacillus yonginensis]ANS73708.1 hypothetical protein AWM70_03235 [Paenibacillus yonginensis]